MIHKLLSGFKGQRGCKTHPTCLQFKYEIAVMFFPLQAAAIKHTLHSQVSASDVKLADHEPT